MGIVKPRKVAVVGAGIAGASCARALSMAGHTVQVFDKSRGPGGRLATRRLEWIDGLGRDCTTRLDHGAIGIAPPRSTAFQAFIDRASKAGWLASWSPRLAPDSLALDHGPMLHVPVPDMPELCRRLLDGVVATGSFSVDSLHRVPRGWQLASGHQRHAALFDAVVLAAPPAQAAPLLSPHRSDWARHASVAPMQPCWTLIGVADEQPVDAASPASTWDLCRPPSGPLAWVMRSDARPGRPRVRGQAHWVAHARAGWSARNLEQPAAWVSEQLQAALAAALGGPVDWHRSAVHRWRYALPQAQSHGHGHGQAHRDPHGRPPADATARYATAPDACWWDAALGLGVCGDFLGGDGVEGAWLSGLALARSIGVAVEMARHEAEFG